MRMRGISVILILSALSSGCNILDDSEPPVDCELIQQGASSGIKVSLELIVSDQNAWVTLWNQHTSTSSPQPPVPQIDFQSSAVVVIFSGQKPTGGYGILLTDIFRRGNDIAVKYRETAPLPGPVSQALTEPFLMLRVHKPPGTILIEKE